MNKQIKFIDLGVMDYKDAWDYQQKLFDEIIEIKIELEELRESKRGGFIY